MSNRDFVPCLFAIASSSLNISVTLYHMFEHGGTL